MTQSRFARPRPHPPNKEAETSPNLYVANCGPAVGLSLDDVAAAFGAFGNVVGVHPADATGARVIICYSNSASARTAMGAWGGRACPDLGGRILQIRYSVPRPPIDKVMNNDLLLVSMAASELGIPGIYLLHDFINAKEEQELLTAVDAGSWKSLSKRRVQHYGYEFLYEKRSVDPKQFLGELPPFVSPILEKISLFPNIDDAKSKIMDQLTVNEYPPGVGLSPHIDTHSAFNDLIFSLSLAGPCIMEFRKYSESLWHPQSVKVADMEGESPGQASNFIRKAIYLPPRSMLLLSGEGRYAWHHYIPHHKVDMVGKHVMRRGLRRVSLTFREVRTGPCSCEYPQFCDSQTENQFC